MGSEPLLIPTTPDRSSTLPHTAADRQNPRAPLLQLSAEIGGGVLKVVSGAGIPNLGLLGYSNRITVELGASDDKRALR